MLQLIAENPGNADAVIPLRWCVSPVILAELKEKGAIHPHLLISVHNGDRETERKCVPLEQAIEYVDFTTPGENIINAVIVWDQKNGDPRKLVQEVIRRQIDVHNWDGAFDPTKADFDRDIRMIDDHTGELSVNVPSQFFAHEPPEWEKKWVNFWFELPPRDQCQYRQRRIVAYTVQAPLTLMWVIWNSFYRIVYAGVTLLHGSRGLNLRPILHPFRDSISEIWTAPRWEYDSYEYGGFSRQDLEGWISPRNNFFHVTSKGERRRLGFGLLYPPFWVVILGTMPFFKWVNLSTMTLIGGFAMFLATISIILLVGITLRGIYAEIMARTAPDRARMAKEQEADSARRRLSALDDVFVDVVCMPSLRPDINTLRRRPINLRFKAAKARVCRPYIVR